MKETYENRNSLLGIVKWISEVSESNLGRKSTSEKNRYRSYDRGQSIGNNTSQIDGYEWKVQSSVNIFCESSANFWAGGHQWSV